MSEDLDTSRHSSERNGHDNLPVLGTLPFLQERLTRREAISKVGRLGIGVAAASVLARTFAPQTGPHESTLQPPLNAVQGSSTASKTGNQLSYKVDARNTQTRTPVIMELTTAGSQKSVVFIIKPSGPTGKDYAKTVQITSVIDGAGNPLTIQHPNPFTWSVTKTDNKIVVNYDVDWRQPHAVPGTKDFEAYLDSWGGYIKEYFLLLRPVLAVDTVTVTFNLPSGWNLITPRELTDATTFTFAGQTLQYSGDMWSSLVAIGNPKLISQFKSVGITGNIYNFATANPSTSANILADRFSKVIQFYQSVMGDSPLKNYVIVIGDSKYFPTALGALNALPIAIRGIDTSPSAFGTGFATSEGLTTVGNTWMDFAHNIFHTWLRQKIFPAVEQDEDQGSKQWFYEGFSNYYAALAMLKTSMWDQPTYDSYYQSILNDANTRYTGKYAVPLPLTPKLLADSGDPAYLKENYVKGDLIAYSLNQIMQSAIGQSKSLDDVMKVMYQQYGLGGTPFTNVDVFWAFNFVLGQDFSALFGKYVYGSENLPMVPETRGISVDPSVQRYLGTVSPLVDAHNHLTNGLTVENLVSLMDDSIVKTVVLMPIFYQQSNGTDIPQGISDESLISKFTAQQPDRIIPIFGMQRDLLADRNRWLNPDGTAETFLNSVESGLKSGLYKGMGEFIINHYGYSFASGITAGRVKIPADTTLMRRFLDLSAKYNIPVIIHYEIDADSKSSLLSMLDYAQSVGSIVVLCCGGGRPDPETMRTIMGTYPNLRCDLGGMTRYEIYGSLSGPYSKNPIEDGTWHLLPEWKSVYEQFPDRFTIGVDSAYPQTWALGDHYRSSMSGFRMLLSDLSPATALAIGSGNALSLWKSPATSTTTSTAISSKSTSTTPTVSTTSPATSTSQRTSASEGGGGIPDFPFLLGATTIFTLLLTVFYLLVRSHRSPSQDSSQPIQD